MERAVAVAVELGHVDATLEQPLQQHAVLALRRQHQRRLAARLWRLEAAAEREEVTHRRDLTLAARPVQWAHARCLDHFVDGRAAAVQMFQHLQLPHESCPMCEGRAVVGVPSGEHLDWRGSQSWNVV